MAYNKFKDLEKKTQSDIVFKNKALKMNSNPKSSGYARGLASMVYKFFDKKSKGSCLKENQGDFLQNLQLADEPINQFLEILKKEKCILLLSTIFGVLIYLICN